MTAAATASRILARHLAARDHDALPRTVRANTEALLADYLAVASSGSRTETGGIAYRTAIDLSGSGASTVIGRTGRLSADGAAFVNATAAHSLEFDDIDATSYLHYGAPVASAAFAVAEREHADGRALIAAVAAGAELMARLSSALNPRLRDRGFHTTTAVGPFGGALAAGMLLGLDEDGLVDALAFAGAQASGLMEIYGASMQKRFNPGFAARNGVVAALLSAGGARGEETVLDGRGGFGAAFGGGLDLDVLLGGLGSEERARVEIKPYACVRPLHSALDAVIALRAAYRFRPEDIAAVAVHRPPAWADYFLVPAPRSRHEAQVSLQYAVAAAAVHGDADPDRFDVGADPRVLAVTRAATAETDPCLPGDLAARIDIRLRSGETISETRTHPLGSAEQPLDEAARRAKAERLMRPVYGRATDGVLDDAFRVRESPDVSVLLGRLRAAATGTHGS
jgi:2-methylcitrate dehydratase PrpD